MNINKIDTTSFDGKVRFVRPNSWNENIKRACEENKFLNNIAEQSPRDLWLDMSTRKPFRDEPRYKITATISESKLAHITKRIFGFGASFSRRFHREGTVIYDVLDSFDKSKRRQDFLSERLGILLK